MDGKIVVITGGNRGIGFETSRGLLERGAVVINLSRSDMLDQAFDEAIADKFHSIRLDLGDLETIDPALENIARTLDSRKIDILISNAGIPSRGPHQVSRQGYELTFAVNVLGHHVLFKECHSRSLLSPNAQIIAVAGDAYSMTDDCTSDYSYDGDRDLHAYARSKVGVMWWGYHCSKLFTEFNINLVHPGVVLTEFGGEVGVITKRVFGAMLLNPEAGAQMTLICATQPDMESGAYYHNTIGKAILPEDDVALDSNAAEDFWNMLEQILKSFKTQGVSV